MDKTSGGSVTRTVTYYPSGAMRINSTLYYTLKDHLSSASVVTDSTGAVVGEQRYYPFGETRLATGSMFTDKLFTGQREMAGLGIYHYGARFYSPKLGRFLSADSMVPNAANPQDFNRYSYVRNNPIRYTDPSGNIPIDCYNDPSYCSNTTTLPSSPYKPKPAGGGNNNNNGGNSCSGPNPSVVCIPTPTSQPDLPTIPTTVLDPVVSNGCTSTRPCIGPKPEDPSWWNLDPSSPDYYILSVSAGPIGLPGVTGTLAIDRYKNVYGGLGVNYGKSMESFSASLTGGFIGSPFDDVIPDPVNIQSFMTGWAINGGIGVGGGGGVTWSPGANQTFVSNVAVEGGIYLPPSLGVSAVHSWMLGNPFIPGDQ